MRLECPKCGAKGDPRERKTPRWRCSPAPGNGGCGYEWDDPNYDAPAIDYKTLGYSDKEHYEYITGFDARIREEQRARIKIKEEQRARRLREEELRRNPPPPPTPPKPTPNADSDGPKEHFLIGVGRIAPPSYFLGQLSFLFFTRPSPALVATVSKGCRNDP